MANLPSVQIEVHRCYEFEEANKTARFPKQENGNIGRVPAVILHAKNHGWVLRFVDAIEMPCSFCPFCGEELPNE